MPPGIPQSTASTRNVPRSDDPLSPSFDPTPPTPAAHIAPIQQLYPLADATATPFATHALHPQTPGYAGADATNALWAHRLSVSLGAIAEQIAQAGKALANRAAPRRESWAEVAALVARMEIMERAQEHLARRVQVAELQMAPSIWMGAVPVAVDAHGSSGSRRTRGGQADALVADDGSGEAPRLKSATETVVEELQQKVEGIIEMMTLDQSRLYARLHNATITSNKMTIMAPATAAGKAPPTFPATKGEFEHLTKERYEAILEAYNVQAKGDTPALRETLREFIGLTPAAHR
ncbi:uncharacterized protein BXZ73DRAFT_43287 [Epithele typhae]|uniref:uncharacterized protein n=1 Tax=Epithele typhae TaxID=378194 RepID=UPI002007BC5A|nr:uncharacterized protein BXZ73DRAFT_43287 [Epithele typhae]KAH9940062.1 hypothetical protein BXZ73DRAFT_43287 [Epithele typhae]